MKLFKRNEYGIYPLTDLCWLLWLYRHNRVQDIPLVLRGWLDTWR